MARISPPPNANGTLFCTVITLLLTACGGNAAGNSPSSAVLEVNSVTMKSAVVNGVSACGTTIHYGDVVYVTLGYTLASQPQSGTVVVQTGPSIDGVTPLKSISQEAQLSGEVVLGVELGNSSYFNGGPAKIHFLLNSLVLKDSVLGPVREVLVSQPTPCDINFQ